MKTKPELEKEIRDLEWRCRDLRNKRSDIEKESRKAFNEKVSIQKDISGFIAEKSNLSKEVSGLKEKINKADEISRKSYLLVARERAALDQEKARQADGWIEVDDAKELLSKEIEKTVNARSKITDECSALKKEESRIKAENVNLNNRAREFERTLVSHKRLAENFAKAQQLLSVKHQEASYNIDNAKACLSGAITRQKGIDKKYEVLSSKEFNLTKREKELESKKKSLEAIDAGNKNLVRIIESRERHVRKSNEALSLREKEIQITSLRVEKIIKEKNIKAELKKLEKESKG